MNETDILMQMRLRIAHLCEIERRTGSFRAAAERSNLIIQSWPMEMRFKDGIVQPWNEEYVDLWHENMDLT